MITVDDYTALTGEDIPEGFCDLLSKADVIINQMTCFGLIGRDVSAFPQFVAEALKRAYVYQIQYMRTNADSLNDSGMQSFTLGKFSMSSGSSSTEAASPMALNCVQTVNAYLRGLM